MKLKGTVISLLNRSEPTRDALEWWIHRQTKIYVLSYPKCGRTWLRLMIGKALDEHYQLRVPNPMELGHMYGLHRDIPRIRVTHEHAHRAEVIEADKHKFRGKTVVFLVRDPRDVVVSMYFEASRRSTLFTGELGEFIRQPVGGIDAIIAYYNAWADSAHVPRRFALVRYEDLHHQPAPVLANVLDTMELPVAPTAIEAAIGFSKFDNMRKLEIANTFKSARLRPAKAGDAESFKTRKGKIGGYRQYMSPADLDYVNARIATQLSPAYAEYRAADTQLRA
jgi:sulfotransferase family protein